MEPENTPKRERRNIDPKPPIFWVLNLSFQGSFSSFTCISQLVPTLSHQSLHPFTHSSQPNQPRFNSRVKSIKRLSRHPKRYVEKPTSKQKSTYPLKRDHSKRKFIFQPSIFREYSLVFRGEGVLHVSHVGKYTLHRKAVEEHPNERTKRGHFMSLSHESTMFVHYFC